MLQDTNIEGIGQVQYSVAVEYVPTSVSSLYLTSIQTIRSILDSPNPSQTNNNDYDRLYAAISALKNLAKSGVADTDHPDLAQYMTAEMMQNFQNVILVLQGAGASLIPTTDNLLKDGLIGQISSSWKDLKGFGLAQVITNALNVYTDPRSLQSMIELEYVKAGNDLLLQSLSSLQKALQSNQNSLDTLTIIQNISNKIQVKATGTFSFPPKNLGDLSSVVLTTLLKSVGTFFISAHSSVGYLNPSGPYNILNPLVTRVVTGANPTMNLQYLHDLVVARGVPITTPYTGVNPPSTPPQSWAFYNGELINPDVSLWTTKPDPTLLANQTTFTSAVFTTANTSVLQFEKIYKIAASSFFTQKSVYSTASAGDVVSLLAAKNALAANIASVEALTVEPLNDHTIPNTLPYFLFKVLNDLSAAFNGAVTPLDKLKAAQKWIIDNQNVPLAKASGSLAQGLNQGDITQAIAAAQSLNDSQKQNVQQAMFIFQEYYKSSSGVLQNVNELITRMAQSINR